MISHRMRENRRLRALKLPKNIERMYKEKKCRECAVVVKRMDFAKILGKFTKVKIQYESSTPKSKKNVDVTSPNSNARLKSNENGMVLIHRNAYNQHPVKELQSSNKKVRSYPGATPRPATNVLKENNRLKKTPLYKDKNSNINISSSNLNTPLQSGNKKNIRSRYSKQYGIIFDKPTSKKKNVIKSKISLAELLPLVDASMLPSPDWSIDYLPRSVEPTDDKVYDRIAAELEDLMYNEHPKEEAKPNATENKVDDFPSIMDILNDNPSENDKSSNQSTSVEFKTSLESSDVEAMLLGKIETTSKEEEESTPMEVDSSVMSNLIEDVAQLDAIDNTTGVPESKIELPVIDELENPQSPSILDEALQKGIEEHLPCEPKAQPIVTEENLDNSSGNVKITKEKSESPTKSSIKVDPNVKPTQKISFPSNLTHLVFTKSLNGKSTKTVKCPKNLKYSIELDGKTVEFLGAPQVISSLEDLQVLLQIVNETELENLYVYH